MKPLAWVMVSARIRPEEVRDRDGGLHARVRLQKLVFLLAGVVREFSRYRFNLYIYGPYSPELARDYFQLAESGAGQVERLAKEYTPPQEAARLLEELSKLDTDTLELVATAVDLARELDRYGLLTRRNLERRLRAAKGWATPEEIRNAVETAIKLGLIPGMSKAWAGL